MPAGSSASETPCTVSAKIELVIVGTTTATIPLRFEARPPATRFGT